MPVHALDRRSAALLLALALAACGTSHEAVTIDSTKADGAAPAGMATSESAPKDSNQAYRRVSRGPRSPAGARRVTPRPVPPAPAR